MDLWVPTNLYKSLIWIRKKSICPYSIQPNPYKLQIGRALLNSITAHSFSLPLSNVPCGILYQTGAHFVCRENDCSHLTLNLSGLSS